MSEPVNVESVDDSVSDAVDKLIVVFVIDEVGSGTVNVLSVDVGVSVVVDVLSVEDVKSGSVDVLNVDDEVSDVVD